jgi:hypothetical protein
MVKTEDAVWKLLDRFVPNSAAQLVLLDLAQWRYRNAARGMSDARRIEIAATAEAFAPDPFTEHFPTYQRFVYLATLYDISLGFEQSPLIGCTTFALGPESTASGAPLLARAFDFEVDDVFDEKKAVFLVREEGMIPFASVAWPGLVGVVSGMNLEGLALVVHGARAGPTETEGEPVVHSLRRVLSEGRTTADAVRLLAARPAMVSHIVIAIDAGGEGAAVERIPGSDNDVTPLRGGRVVTNHLEGPGSSDPKNVRVQETTSTLARHRRGEALLAEHRGKLDTAAAVALLRDRNATGGDPLPLGDRRAIDALIATHGVVMNTRDRLLWVSESPHLLGRFVAFDLERLLSAEFEPEADSRQRETIAADPLLESPRFRDRSPSRSHAPDAAQ